jgi:hypothetical protein
VKTTLREFLFALVGLSAVIIIAGMSANLAGCSIFMEVTRPTPVDLGEFQAGTSRATVLGKLGAPDGTVTEGNGEDCDLYRLYTRGYGASGKLPIATAEVAADVFTLGLAEIILTPAEALTMNEKHAVSVCYDDGQKLVRTTEK